MPDSMKAIGTEFEKTTGAAEDPSMNAKSTLLTNPNNHNFRADAECIGCAETLAISKAVCRANSIILVKKGCILLLPPGHGRCTLSSSGGEGRGEEA
jgi:hypothetical protein